MRRISICLLIALSFIWFGACQRCFAQQIIGRPMLPLISGPPSGAFIWYKMENQSYANGATVTTLTDSGSGGINLTVRDDGTANPVKTNSVAAINNRPVIAWAGAASQIETLHVNPAYSSKTVDGVTLAVVDYHTANASFGNIYNISLSSSDANFSLKRTVVGSTAIRTGQGKGVANLVTITNALETWQVITMQWAASDGVVSIKDNANTVTGGVAGSGNGSLSYFQFQYAPTNQVAECIVYTNKLSAGDLLQLRTYLINKYAISATP